MLEEIIKNTVKYKSSSTGNEQKAKGQFFTGIKTAEFMAGLYTPNTRNIKVLDPGAGNGLLAAALVEKLIYANRCDSLEITFIENDPKIIPTLKKTANIIKRHCKDRVRCKISIIQENFILADIKNTFDVVICNPPYMKIRKDSPESRAMKDFVYGQPNQMEQDRGRLQKHPRYYRLHQRKISQQGWAFRQRLSGEFPGNFPGRYYSSMD